MKKAVIVVAALLVAAVASAPAEAAKREANRVAAKPSPATHMVPGLTPEEAANPNWAAARFTRDAIPLFLPSYILPMYLAVNPTAGQPTDVIYGKPGQRLKRVRQARRG